MRSSAILIIINTGTVTADVGVTSKAMTELLLSMSYLETTSYIL